ncbi:ATP-binding cassette domain-containing protein [Sediminitomix flava]|uniref:ABC-2 type transport system ATP-binding protein n=1 Tax=Sediminitomix flava TaxID=379075 RepID=A0A315YWR1_SEDFL|nr:ATP-binding cassette domain-containing protein [Sediminitomix flava]PWJ34210.1 ABC-2 type transport system ATP-binding protein [Sediminitomix flava]
MISVKDLCFAYSSDKLILDHLNLELKENQIHGIVGLNGAGKTTFLHTLFGLNKPLEGKLLFNGEPLTKKQIAYLVTENYFYANITAREYLELVKNTDFNIEEWNALFGLPLDDLIENYSTGMKKKIAFLAMLKQDKAIMILDEPFNGLDLESSRIIRSLLLKLKEKGKTILLTSHVLETLTNVCDKLHHLENGQINYSCEKEDFDVFEQKIYQTIEKRNQQKIEELLD